MKDLTCTSCGVKNCYNDYFKKKIFSENQHSYTCVWICRHCGREYYGRSDMAIASVIEKERGVSIMKRSKEEIIIDLKKCREERRNLYIEKLNIKKKLLDNNINMTKLRMEEERSND